MAAKRSGAWVFPAVCALFAAGLITIGQAVPPLGLWVFITILAGWLITLCLHEFAHALLALAGGDYSVKTSGYLTLNPARYVDTANSIVIPLILLAIGGIPLPGGAMHFYPSRLRHRGWPSLIAAGGPATNLIAGAILAALSSQIGGYVGATLAFLALLQFIATILNLLPVPGFDGYGIIAPMLSSASIGMLQRYGRWLPLAVFGVIFFVPGVARVLFDAGYGLLELFGGDRFAAAVGAGLFQFWR